MKTRIQKAIDLLRDLIRIQSYSREEHGTAKVIQDFFKMEGIPTERIHNNIIVKSKSFQTDRATVILNSHHDTVKIGEGWTHDPLGANVVEDKLYGRGSNDAGGCLVSLIAAFCHLYHKELPYNLMLVASGEEENFGPNGVSSVLETLDLEPDLGIIGEPTFVIDCRINENYTLQEVFDTLQIGTHSNLTPRSLRWHSSGIDKEHPIVQVGMSIGRNIFGSPTLSDQVHFTCPTIKIGPGKSERSHTSDEYVRLSEIQEAIPIYIQLLEQLKM
ncbi:UNVERIFIED_CONTAM: hypothetical protein GTU68_047637 [Idotea baltica]|nr:hypothetical protein [Idotea baltica]